MAPSSTENSKIIGTFPAREEIITEFGVFPKTEKIVITEGDLVTYSGKDLPRSKEPIVVIQK